MIDTMIFAIYTMVPDAHSVRMWVLPERKSTLFKRKRELLRFQITQNLADKLPDEIVHFEFRILEDATPPFEFEADGFWTYFHPGMDFSGAPKLFPAAEKYVQRWKERTGHDSE